MRPFARDLAAAGGDHGLAVWSLQNRVRGWNGDERAPVADARWALAQVQTRHGDVPVVIVGHSMGGRSAVHVAGASNVVAVAALAPWLPRGEPFEQVAGRAVLVVHGQLDTTTSPRGSLEWARQAATVTERIWRVEVRRERHAMLWRAALWHRLATQFTAAALGWAPLPDLLADAPADGRLTIEV
jgi:dienelactone hydrolase